ncbi:MAG: phage tail tape measure protein [Pseudomonadota bacterium]
MKEFGIGFVVGATLSPVVNNVFSTVEEKIKATGQSFTALTNKAKAFQTVAELQAKHAERTQEWLKGNVNDELFGKEVRTYNRELDKARKIAEQYGPAVLNYADAHAKAAREVLRTESALKKINRAKELQDQSKNLRSRMRDSLVPVAAMAFPIRSAIQFESSMADVAKTMDGMRSKTGELTPAYYEMEQAVLRMGRTLPLAHTELANLFAVGGQQGMTSTKELEEFATMAAHMGVAFGMSSEEAADAIGGYRTALGMAMPEVRSMLDLMNQYANTGTATEAGIASIVRRVGGLGQVGGVAAKPMTALAATLESMKVSPEIAATGIKNLILSMTSGAAATKTQSEAFAKLGIDSVALAESMQKDAPAAILSVLEAVKTLPKAEQLSIMQQIFGKESLGAIAPLLDQLDLLKENLAIAGDSTAYAGAMQEEFTNRSKTTANALIIAQNRLSELSTTLTKNVLPPLVSVLEVMGPVISSMATFAGENKTLTSVLVGAIVGFTLLRPVIFGCMAAYKSVSASIHLARAAMILFNAQSTLATLGMVKQRAVSLTLTAANKAMAVGQWALNAALTANPIGIVVMAVAGLVTGLVLLYNNCETVRNIFDTVFTFIGDKVGWAMDKLEGLWGGLKSVGSFFGFGDDDSSSSTSGGSNTGSTFSAATPMSEMSAMSTNFGMSRMPDDTTLAALGSSGGNTTVNFSVNMNGVTDADFAKRVSSALEARRGDLERLISSIVDEQRRLAYA